LFRQAAPLSVVVDVDGLFPLGDRQFVFGGGEPAVIHAPAVGIRVAGGAEWTF
jgi:hypothetical protein